jgi:hypothetical protein
MVLHFGLVRGLGPPIQDAAGAGWVMAEPDGGVGADAFGWDSSAAA